MNTLPSKAPPDPKFILKKEMGLVHCFNLSNCEDETECKSLYVGTEEGDVYIWDLTTFNLRFKQKVGYSIQALHFYDSLLITQEKNGEIRIFDQGIEELIQIHPTISTNPTFCKSIMIQHRLFTAAEFIEIVNMKTREKEESFSYDKTRKFGMIMCLTEIVEDSKSLIMALHETGDGIFWDPFGRTVVDQVLFKPQPLSAAFNKKNGRGLVVGISNTIQVFEINNMKPGSSKIIYEIEVPFKGNLTVVRSRPDGKVFVVGGSDGKLRCFSWKTLKLLVVLNEHNNTITEIRYSPQKISACSDNPLVASSADGVLSFWDIY